MNDTLGLRERKKHRTRRALIEAGLRLFDREGYEQTSVARIAAAAEVSRATFFNYFSSKEELVLGEAPGLHTTLMREALAGRRPDEPVEAVLMSAVRHMLDSDAWTFSPNDELVVVRARLLTSVPALRMATQSRLATLQRDWTELVLATFPTGLNRTEAAALVGALTGAITTAVFATIEDGQPLESLPQIVEHAATIALRGRGYRTDSSTVLSLRGR